MLTSDFSPKVEIRPFRSCAIYPAIIIGTVRSLWTCLWGRYHVPQNAFLVRHVFLVYYPHFSPSFPFRRKMLPSSPFWGALLAPAGSGESRLLAYFCYGQSQGNASRGCECRSLSVFQLNKICKLKQRWLVMNLYRTLLFYHRQIICNKFSKFYFACFNI